MSKNRKPKRPSRLPAIVPRFLKSAVTVGAIPTLWGCGNNHPRTQPVVAYMQTQQPVVAAYQREQQPDQPIDAGAADAAPTPVQAPVVAAVIVQPPPPPPVVAAMMPHPVVAAMVPHPHKPPPPPPKKKPSKPPKATKQPPPPPPPELGVAAMFVPVGTDALVPDATKPKSKKP